MSDKIKNTGTPSILNQWKNRKQKTAVSTSIVPRSLDAELQLSSGQERLCFLQQLYPNRPFYQYAHRYLISGRLHEDYLIQSFQGLMDRHEILRSNYEISKNNIQLKINKTYKIPFNTLDISNLDEVTQNEQAESLSMEFALKTFDLNRDVLLRICLVKLSEQKHILLLSIHHIIGDRASLLLLNQEVFANYQSLVEKKEIQVTALDIQYPDFSIWQKEQKTKAVDIEYWKNQLAGELPILSVPNDFARQKNASYKGANIARKFSKSLSKDIAKLAKELATTPYNLLLSAFKILLYRYSNQTDILVGSPFSNRDKVALEKLIGFFNETLVLRTQINESWTFKDLVESLKTTTLKALEHKNLAFDELVRILNPERHDNINPLFQAMFLYNNMAAPAFNNIDLAIDDSSIDLGVSKFDLTLFVTEKEDYLETTMEFSTDLFLPEKIHKMLKHLENILSAVVKNINQKISHIPLLDVEETKLIVSDWNQTKWDMPSYFSIHQLIEEFAIKQANSSAVVFENDEITYAELNDRANCVAQELLKNNLQKGQYVGLYADRSTHLIVGLLAILKAGGAYLPLDPTYPADRIEYMVEDSGANIILSQEGIKGNLVHLNAEVISIELSLNSNKGNSIPLPEVNPSQTAYVIYTSGSTGKPKGVPIRHENLLHSTLSRFSFYPSNPSAFLLLSSFSFDSSIVGIFWTLCSGGKLVIPPRRIEQDIEKMATLISKHQVSHTLLLPSLYTVILNHAKSEQLQSLVNVMVAGEACPLSLIDKHFSILPTTELYNEYGPTEASVWCIAHQITGNEKRFVPIGKAIPNTQAYILDKYAQAVPVGVSGELFIGGLGLAKAYLNRPELTKEKFVTNPFDENSLLYKTGDLACFHEDGLIEFLGRVDHQVKIRGFRVEPEEIQKVILQHNLVLEALVEVYTKKTDHQKQLVAYISGIEESHLSDLKKYLSAKLPDYMVPAIMIPLDAFPRLPNGKLNRHQLPEPSQQFITKSTTFVAPRKELEISLAEIWKTVLNLNKIGITDNFFALGGDSILSIQVVSRARDAGITLAANQLFEHQTIEALVLSIESKTDSISDDQITKVIDFKDRYSLTPLQQAFLFNSKREGLDHGQLLLEFCLEGAIEHDTFRKAWLLSCEQHEVMRTFINHETGKAPIQIIAKETKLDWEVLNWTSKSKQEQKIAFSNLQKGAINNKINLSAYPNSRLKLVCLSKNDHVLVWVCHHIYLDGWSCGIILKDALAFYENLILDREIKFRNTSNYPSFLNWKANQVNTNAEQFWESELKDFDYPLLFHNDESNQIPIAQFKDVKIGLTKEDSIELRAFAKRNQVSLSSLFQGVWAMLLSQYFDTKDVVYGLTVTGRFVDFPAIESLSGLFMNVIPNRISIDENISFSNWLKDIQKSQGQKNKFEDSSLEEIKRFTKWPTSIELFDSLFVFGNFLKDGMKVGDLNVKDFKGGFSSAYPLTIRVNPIAAIDIQLRYDQSSISKETIHWFELALRNLLQNIQKIETPLIQNNFKQIDLPTKKYRLASLAILTKVSKHAKVKSKENYRAPQTETELTLTKIWETLFNFSPIGSKDNYFELGGRSIMAIQLFAEIETQLDTILPPVTLIKHPTIVQLAAIIDKVEPESATSSTLVALRPTGDRAPLFCLHGGGAHVFFYQGLSKYLSKAQPVYSLQPVGLDGKTKRHQSIEEMASHYLKEIKKVQASGPYHILGTCFSNAVALEMGNQLLEAGEKIARLFIIDSAPVHLFGDDEDGKSKTFVRFADMLKRGDYSRIFSKIKRRFLPNKEQTPPVDTKEESASERNLRLTIESLNNMYAMYDWKPFDGQIHFIRSSEFHNRTDKKYHLTQWNKLAKKGVKLHVVEGHHTSLFEEPEVEGLSEKINECIVNTSH